jgi:hypothetical protein
MRIRLDCCWAHVLATYDRQTFLYKGFVGVVQQDSLIKSPKERYVGPMGYHARSHQGQTVKDSSHEDVGQTAPKVGEVLRVFMIALTRHDTQDMT